MQVPEVQWTPATLWCPHPEWWHSDMSDPDPAEAEVSALVYAMIRATQPEVVVETGTATGVTAEMIGRALLDNGHGHLWTVEIDPVAAAKATRLVAGLPVTVAVHDSLDWWPPDKIDFAWIDSGPAHVRVGEVNRWQQVFTPGALIGVHDTAPTMSRDVTRSALHALLDGLGWHYLDLATPRGVTIAQVPISIGIGR
jgi:predicted O-methyltransferase YrrM